mgnify:CR=1 FL=1
MQYGALSRMLHQLALGNRFLAEASFDVETLLHRTDPAPVVGRKHVFVAGMARAGTTLLMRRFHATGAFRSLTYRDMPFVLMPSTWAWLSASSGKLARPQERSHGDGLLVDYDSPEALEEVFWRVFAGDRYLRDDRLVPMTADEEIVERFRVYVAAVLRSRRSDPAVRYLSKNNNNLLRLPVLCRAFPNAVVIVPFRDPAPHADSLLAQHRRFVAMHRTDPFARKYMTWLAHHEFGSDHRPFRFPGDTLTYRNRDNLDYWMELWIHTYEWLLGNAPASVVFQGYEDLCANPDEAWSRLAAFAEIPGDVVGAEKITLRCRTVDGPIDAGLKRHGEQVYAGLVERARAGRAPGPGFPATASIAARCAPGLPRVRPGR